MQYRGSTPSTYCTVLYVAHSRLFYCLLTGFCDEKYFTERLDCNIVKGCVQLFNWFLMVDVPNIVPTPNLGMSQFRLRKRTLTALFHFCTFLSDFWKALSTLTSHPLYSMPPSPQFPAITIFWNILTVKAKNNLMKYPRLVFQESTCSTTRELPINLDWRVAHGVIIKFLSLLGASGAPLKSALYQSEQCTVGDRQAQAQSRHGMTEEPGGIPNITNISSLFALLSRAFPTLGEYTPAVPVDSFPHDRKHLHKHILLIHPAERQRCHPKDDTMQVSFLFVKTCKLDV